jgi:putative sugar O-methyltransferase
MISNNNLLQWEKYSNLRRLFDEIPNHDRITNKHASSFWHRMLEKRNNFPSYNELVTFRREMATGIGYSDNINEKTEQQMFRLNLGRALTVCPVDFLKKHQESNVGHPYQYFWNEILSSSAGLNNCTNAWRILSCLEETNALGAKCILEIGAGYGGVADILIRVLSPNVFVVCDLPENLYLSLFYLSVNHPQYDVCLVHNVKPKPFTRKTLVFCTPEGIDHVKEPYELIVNTHSFQEMKLDEIRRYFKYICENMRNNALFYFLNHFGAAGAKKPSDYPLDMFKIASWRPFPVPQPRFLHRKQAVEVLLRKQNERQWPTGFQKISETLGLLLFAGVNDNLLPICRRLVEGTLSSIEAVYFQQLREVLYCQSPIQGLEIIENLDVPDELKAINSYIVGIMNLIAQDNEIAKKNLLEAIESGLSGFAKSRAHAGLGLIFDMQDKTMDAATQFQKAIDTSPQFEYELKDWKSRMIIELFKRSYKFTFPQMEIKGKLSLKSLLASSLVSAKNLLRSYKKELKV